MTIIASTAEEMTVDRYSSHGSCRSYYEPMVDYLEAGIPSEIREVWDLIVIRAFEDGLRGFYTDLVRDLAWICRHWRAINEHGHFYVGTVATGTLIGLGPYSVEGHRVNPDIKIRRVEYRNGRWHARLINPMAGE